MPIALPGLFTAGLLTFLSPCILPLVPLYLSLLLGASVAEVREGRRRGRLLLVAASFSLGLAAVFVGLGLAATALGQTLVAHRALLLQLGGLAVFVFGLKFLGVLQVSWLNAEARPWLQRLQGGGSLVGSFLFGAAFGLGWTPCVGPVLGSVLTYTASSAGRPATGALYLAVYSAGLAVPLLVVAAIAPRALAWLDRVKRHLPRIEVATGALLALVGVLMITDTLGKLVPSLGSGAIVAAQGAAPAPAPSDGGTCGVGGETACPLPEAPVAAVQGPTMIKLFSPSCTICRRMAPVIAAAERSCAAEGVRVATVDVSTDEGRRTATQYGVRGVPTFLFVDGGGREVARLVGEQSYATMAQTLAVLSGKKCDGYGRMPEATAGRP